MFPRLTPVLPSDNPLLFEIYVSSRAEEMKLIQWTDEVKNTFLESQFQAQTLHYFSKYPDGSFELIKLENQTAGRLYQAELADEIRIIDITLLPQFRNQGIGTILLSDILKKAEKLQKSVRIYLETYNPSQNLFARLGFVPTSNDGVYSLWEKAPAEKQADAEVEISTANKIA